MDEYVINFSVVTDQPKSQVILTWGAPSVWPDGRMALRRFLNLYLRRFVRVHGDSLNTGHLE